MEQANLTSSNRKSHDDDNRIQLVDQSLTPNRQNGTSQTIMEDIATSQTNRTMVQPGAQHIQPGAQYIAAAGTPRNVEEAAPTLSQQKLNIRNCTEATMTAPRRGLQLAAAVDPDSDVAEPHLSSTEESTARHGNQQGTIPLGDAGVQDGGGNIDSNPLPMDSIAETCIVTNITPNPENDGGDVQQQNQDVIIAESVTRKMICGVPRTIFILVTLVVLIVLNVTLGVAFSRRNSSAAATSPHATTTSAPTAAPETGPVLQSIKDRGFIRCRGSSIALANGFSFDLCRAIAAAIFGDPQGASHRIKLIHLPFRDQFAALWDRRIDVSTSLTTHNMIREAYEPSTGLGMAFSTPYFYSGLTFVGIPTYVDCADRHDTLIGLCRGLSVCVIAGTTTSALLDTLLPGALKYEQDDTDGSFAEFTIGTCNVIAGDPLGLREDKVRQAGYKGEYTFGRKTHSNEPLVLTSKGDDHEWASFCDWVLQALITAESLNITQETALSSYLWNVATSALEDEFADTSIFGFDSKNMFRHAIAAVGNYGEMYERHHESIVPRGVEGINTLNRGDTGLLYSYPFGDLMVDISPSSTIRPPRTSEGGTLESIANRGILRCGVLGNQMGFASLQDVDDSSEEKAEATRETIKMWSGLDIEYCRAMAVAVFPHFLSSGRNSDDGIVFVEVGTVEEDGYVALDEDRIDVFAGGSFRLTTDVKEATTGKGFTFTPPYFYYDSDLERNRSIDFGIEMKGVGRSLVTRDVDPQWSTFVRWILNAIIYAEQTGISKANALDMPVVEVFGPNYFQMFRDAIAAVGNYGDMFIRTLEEPYNITRVGQNLVNTEGTPQLFSSPFS